MSILYLPMTKFGINLQYQRMFRLLKVLLGVRLLVSLSVTEEEEEEENLNQSINN